MRLRGYELALALASLSGCTSAQVGGVDGDAEAACTSDGSGELPACDATSPASDAGDAGDATLASDATDGSTMQGPDCLVVCELSISVRDASGVAPTRFTGTLSSGADTLAFECGPDASTPPPNTYRCGTDGFVGISSFHSSLPSWNFPPDSHLHVADDTGASWDGTLGSLAQPRMGCVNLCYPPLQVVVQSN